MPTGFFGLSRRKFSDAELKRMAKAVADGVASCLSTHKGEGQSDAHDS